MMYTILLIEDDIDIRSIIKTYFKKRDIVIIEAIDGFDGLSKLNNSTDLILLDIMMPGIDGYEDAGDERTDSHGRDPEV